jgi:hypothetical protein
MKLSPSYKILIGVSWLDKELNFVLIILNRSINNHMKTWTHHYIWITRFFINIKIPRFLLDFWLLNLDTLFIWRGLINIRWAIIVFLYITLSSPSRLKIVLVIFIFMMVIIVLLLILILYLLNLFIIIYRFRWSDFIFKCSSKPTIKQ